jgi:single-strand DNA-binding protein
MSCLNKIELIGHLGSDPEIRAFSQGGDRFAAFKLPTSERWRDKQSGEIREVTEWHRVVTRGAQLCEFVERNLRKGSLVYVEGQLRYRKWKDDQGVERTMAEIHAFEIKPLGPRKDAKPSQAKPNDAAVAAQQREDEDQDRPDFRW